MSNKINVNRNVQDPFYRYKMPKIVAKVEGKGNGIKTVIANMTEIAKALSRPPTYPTKYFGCELGAQTNFDLKNERYIINGEHDANKLQDILDGFIKKFVLCPACDNPETTLTVKRQAISGKCKACGNVFTADPKQKLSTYILKNPPPSESAETETKEKQEPGSPAEEAEEEVLTPVAAVNGGSNGSENDDDEDWAPEDTLEQEKLTGQIGKMVLDKDLDKSIDERLDMLHQYFKKVTEDGTIQDTKMILNEAERLELKTKAPLLLVDVLFDADVINQIKKYRILLLRFCLNEKKAQRYLLGGFEQLIYENKDILLSKSARIIKTLYDEDICSEEVIISWAEKATNKYIKKEFAKEIIKVAEPVIKWLKEADEDSASDDDDELKVDFDDRNHNVGMIEHDGRKIDKVEVNGIKAEKENGRDEYEIDIDNI